MMEIPFTVETLRVGDLVIGSFPYEIFIERKAVPDLVQSMFDSRLFNQPWQSIASDKIRQAGCHPDHQGDISSFTL